MPEIVICIPVWDNLRFTLVSTQQIFQTTPGDYALLVVDNGSEDDTPRFLRDMEAQHPDKFFTITNPENYGYPRALNQGIAWGIEHGCEYSLCLNNDIIITDASWLECLISPLREDRRQLVGARLIDFNELARFNGEIIPYLEGWALAFHKQFLEDVGRFDEEYSPGWFEDVDLSYRAVKAGYRLTQGASFEWQHRGTQRAGPLWHLGGQTGYGRLDSVGILKRNQAYFAEKFGLEKSERTWLD